MINVNNFETYSRLIPKQRSFQFFDSASGFDTVNRVETVNINDSTSAKFYFIRDLIRDRFYEDDYNSFSSITSMTYFTINTKYLGMGLSGGNPTVITTSLSSNFVEKFNLSSSNRNYYWSSVNHKDPADYRIAVIENSGTPNNANLIKNSFGYTNMDFAKTGSSISISSQKYDVIISDNTVFNVGSGTTLSALYNLGYKILSTGNDSNALASSILTLISSNAGAGNTNWSSSANSQFTNSLLTSGVTGWSAVGSDSGRYIINLQSGVSGVYYLSSTGNGTTPSPSVVLAENSNGGKWIHFQDGLIYSRGSASSLLNNAMQYLTQNTQKNYVLSDMGLIVCPNYKFQQRQTLIGEWKFNETSGTTAYDSGYFSSISANNFVLTNASFTGGYNGNGIYFDPSLSGTGLISSPNDLLKLNLSAFTISFLYKPTTSGTNQYLIEGYVGRPIIGMGSTNRLYLLARDPADTYYATYTSTATFNYNEWNWMGVVWNPSVSSVSFYKNGTFADSFSTSGIIGGTEASGWRIGGRNTVVAGGIYDMLKIMNRPLTPKDMENLWLADTSFTAGNYALTGTTMTPYNDLTINSIINHDECNYTTNLSAFKNKNYSEGYIDFISNPKFGTMVSKLLYLDEDMNVIAVGVPSNPIKKHDKLPTTFSTKIIL